MACLRSSIASRTLVPNFARIREMSSLLRGVCRETGAFCGGGATGFAAGGAAGFAAPGDVGAAVSALLAGETGGVDAGDALLAGLSPAGKGGVCCSLGSSAMDPERYALKSNLLRAA